jgi:hypothetical protein
MIDHPAIILNILDSLMSGLLAGVLTIHDLVVAYVAICEILR